MRVLAVSFRDELLNVYYIVYAILSASRIL